MKINCVLQEYRAEILTKVYSSVCTRKKIPKLGTVFRKSLLNWPIGQSRVIEPQPEALFSSVPGISRLCSGLPLTAGDSLPSASSTVRPLSARGPTREKSGGGRPLLLPAEGFLALLISIEGSLPTGRGEYFRLVSAYICRFARSLEEIWSSVRFPPSKRAFKRKTSVEFPALLEQMLFKKEKKKRENYQKASLLSSITKLNCMFPAKFIIEYM